MNRFESLLDTELGYTNEAESKRLDIQKYLTNIDTGKHNSPLLKAIDKNGQITQVKPSPDFYNFCFVEKNRIDSFARISANTPSNQTQLLANLFGLEEYNNFVKGFTENFEECIDVIGIKSQESKQREAEIGRHRANIDDLKHKLSEMEKEIVKEILQKMNELDNNEKGLVV